MRVTLERSSVLDGPLEEQVVAPRSGDLQIARCEADVAESVLLQHALRRDVVDERRSFQAMESELSESELHNRCD